jgi:hypothetical protein
MDVEAEAEDGSATPGLLLANAQTWEAHMASARGDRKPCTHAGCSGTMQFGREPLPETALAVAVDGEPGWVCSEDPGHFQLAAERSRPEPAATGASHARWDDDGGPAPADGHNTSSQGETGKVLAL